MGAVSVSGVLLREQWVSISISLDGWVQHRTRARRFYVQKLRQEKGSDFPCLCLLVIYLSWTKINLDYSYNLDLVMELVVNGNLLGYITATDGIPEYKAKQISWDLCNGMQYLHSRGIVHRDLKPENVLVVSFVPIIVKIADFGLAKIFHEGTMLRSVCGTPNHMAPEVWLTSDVSEYGLVVDSWSMGVMTFIMLSCFFPFLYDDDEILCPDDFYRRRQIQWDCLPDETSWRARDFIQRLLVHNAMGRLSFQHALQHVWFLDVAPRRISAQTCTSTSTQEVEEVRQILVDI
ncbi:putative serine/threonine-protein kinase fhkC [Hypsizygus marmoreus]|uniref:Serine/threonine-protein kinase fhkC n=1 Tax=Hypsizygus marmoreus TaxID=39966 RepID=A0A369J2A8_HYPMA|nr:putative serine/threonine-protein kinase fhkC [Hypsizygus marmoreus]